MAADYSMCLGTAGWGVWHSPDAGKSWIRHRAPFPLNSRIQALVAHPIEARVVAEWSAIETAPGVFDWSSVQPALATLATRGARATLCLRGESPLHPRVADPGAVPDGAWLQAWTALLRSPVATLGGHLAVIEIGESPHRAFDPASYAFVLKSSSLAVKAEAKANGIEVRVAQGAVGADALAWQKALWDNDAAPYVDILPIAFAGGADVSAAIAGFAAEAALHPPAAELRADVAADEADVWSSFRGAVTALASSAPAALVTLPEDRESAEVVARVVASLQSRLASEYAPAPLGKLALRNPEGGVTEGVAVLGRFLHAKDFATLASCYAHLVEHLDNIARTYGRQGPAQRIAHDKTPGACVFLYRWPPHNR